MNIISAKDYRAGKAWDALLIATINGVTIKLHWSDKPYIWHINDGEEVFVVLDGCVDMFYKTQGIKHSVQLNCGDIFHASVGTEHVAHPRGEARILVVERQGSI